MIINTLGSMKNLINLVFFFSYSDLLVGAPYHRHGKFREHGDEGRVYVYMNNGQVGCL